MFIFIISLTLQLYSFAPVYLQCVCVRVCTCQTLLGKLWVHRLGFITHFGFLIIR